MVDELSRVKQRIHKLGRMTTSNGCTEEEAMNAMEKIGELLDHYELNMSDVQITEHNVVSDEIVTNYKNHPLDSVFVALAKYTDTLVWKNIRFYSENNKRKRYVSYSIFGYSQDVEVFKYIYDVIYNAYNTSLEFFKNSKHYHSSSSKKTSVASFKNGFVKRISERISELKSEREHRARSYGRDIVPMKMKEVQNEHKKYYGFNVRYVKKGNSTVSDKQSFMKGVDNANNVSINSGISSSNEKRYITHG